MAATSTSTRVWSSLTSIHEKHGFVLGWKQLLQDISWEVASEVRCSSWGRLWEPLPTRQPQGPDALPCLPLPLLCSEESQDGESPGGRKVCAASAHWGQPTRYPYLAKHLTPSVRTSQNSHGAIFLLSFSWCWARWRKKPPPCQGPGAEDNLKNHYKLSHLVILHEIFIQFSCRPETGSNTEDAKQSMLPAFEGERMD